MEVTLLEAPGLPTGAASLPPAAPGAGVGRLRLGSAVADVRVVTVSPPGEVRLAPDLWQRLAVPFAGIRLRLREAEPDMVELGPSVTLICPGYVGTLSPQAAALRFESHCGHRVGEPALLAVACEQAIDWEQGTVEGYVLDNRAGQAGGAVAARFPIPAAVQLIRPVRRDTARRLGDWTGQRAFNPVGTINKWQFHTMLSAVPGVGEHLPDTRRLRGPADLAAMLVRYGTVYVKNVWSVRGQSVARVCQGPDGLEVRDLNRRQPRSARFPDLAAAFGYLQEVVGKRCLVQQGLPIIGRKGRAVDFRLVVVRDGSGQWHCPVAHGKVSKHGGQVITSLEAQVVSVRRTLEQHFGATREQAGDTGEQMVELCLAAAGVLDQAYRPLGILGFDVAVDAEAMRPWLLEANSVPAWKYPDHITRHINRSQVDFALWLAGFPPGTSGRLP